MSKRNPPANHDVALPARDPLSLKRLDPKGKNANSVKQFFDAVVSSLWQIVRILFSQEMCKYFLYFKTCPLSLTTQSTIFLTLCQEKNSYRRSIDASHTPRYIKIKLQLKYM